MTTYQGTINGDSQSGAYDTMYGLDGNDILGTTNSGAEIDGGKGNDYIGVGQGASSVSLYGGDGGDIFFNHLGTFAYMYGGYGNDLMSGSDLNVPSNNGVAVYLSESTASISDDYMEGGQGIDAIYGFGGDDVIYGGDGNDTGSINVSAGGVVTNFSVIAGLFGGDGFDFIDGGNGNDNVDGGVGDDDLYGGAGNDTLYGGADSDTLYGGAGTNTIYGGAGQDQMSTEGFNDVAYGGTEGDIIYSFSAGSTLYGGDGHDSMAAGNSAATIYGDAGDDVIFGGFGNDIIYGGTNLSGTYDYIGGYYGNDQLYGGTGTDGFNLKFDVRVGEYDSIGDWGVGGNQDQIYVNAAFASATTWTQQLGYVDMAVTLGTGSYHAYVFGTGVTVANVQANTFFL